MPAPRSPASPGSGKTPTPPRGDAKRRAYKTGTLTERAPGVWTVRISYGRDRSAPGKYLRDTFTVRGTQRDAERELRKRLTRQDQHEGGSLREARKIGFGEFAKDALARNPQARRATRERMQQLFDRYTSRRLKNVSLAEVSPALLAEERARLLEQKNQQRHRASACLSPKTVTSVMAIWAAVLRIATEEERIPVNPMGRGKVKWPKIDTTMKGKALTPEETQRALEAADGDPWAALWRVLLTLGPRPSEALALKWADVDWDRGTLTIGRALVRVQGVWEFAPTKTGKPRTVPLPLPVRVALERHQKRQAEERKAAGDGYQDQGLVFADPAGRIVPAWSFKRIWKRLLKTAQVPSSYRLYDTRHTAATRLVEHGADYTNVASILGNSATMVAAVYGHARLDVQRAALDAVAEKHAPRPVALS